MELFSLQRDKTNTSQFRTPFEARRHRINDTATVISQTKTGQSQLSGERGLKH